MRRLLPALPLALALAWGLPARGADDGNPEDGDSAETASKSVKRHRRVSRAKASRWSGSVSLVLGSCLRQASDVNSDPALDQVPCSPDLDTAAADHTGGIAVGFDADAAYEATKHLTLSVDGFYEPVGHSLFTTLLGAYEVPFRKNAAVIHELSVGLPFAPGNRPGDPTAVTFTESLELTPPKWQIDTGIFYDVYIGDQAPVAGHGAEAALQLLPASSRPLGPPDGDAVKAEEHHLGAEFQSEVELSKHWSVGGNFVATIRLDSDANGATLIEATPVAITYRIGHWMDEFATNVAVENLGGPASLGVELTTRYDF